MKKALTYFLLPIMALTMTGCAPQASKTSSNIPVFTPGKDPQFALPTAGEKIAIIETDMGTIKIRLFTKDVPTLTRNFMGLAMSKMYDGSTFHRVVKDFMIQGGDFEKHDGTGGYSYKGPGTFFPNEINKAYHHLYGTVSMAMAPGNPVSIGSQFFIVSNKDGYPSLDGKYSPIGQVYQGMDVVEKIADLQMPGTEAPSKTVTIKKVIITTYLNAESDTQG